MKKIISIASGLAIAATLAFSLAGCGGAATSQSESNEATEAAASTEASAPSIDLSDYMSLKSGECVFITADGNETTYTNKTTTGGGAMQESGLEQLEEYLLETKGSNELKYDDLIDGAAVVCKGDVTAIQKKEDCVAVFVTWAYKYTVLGNTGTPEPSIAIEMSEDEVRNLGIDLESEIMAAGYIDSDLHDGSWKYAELDGPTYYQGGLIIMKSPALVEVVEQSSWK